MPSFGPDDIESGTITLKNGQMIPFTGNELNGWMQSRGMSVDDAADAAQAITGLFSAIRVSEYRDDESDARDRLKTANQRMYNALKNVAGVGGELAQAFADICEAQQEIDRSQSLINRSEDMAILVASGGAGAKLLLRDGNGIARLRSEDVLLGGAALWLGVRALDDDRGSRRSYRRELEDVSTVPK